MGSHAVQDGNAVLPGALKHRNQRGASVFPHTKGWRCARPGVPNSVCTPVFETATRMAIVHRVARGRCSKPTEAPWNITLERDSKTQSLSVTRELLVQVVQCHIREQVIASLRAVFSATAVIKGRYQVKKQCSKGKEAQFEQLSSGQQVITSSSKQLGIFKNEIKIFILSIYVYYFLKQLLGC